MQATTALDILLRRELVVQAWDYFRNVQTEDVRYQSFLTPEDKPMIEMNKGTMDRFAPQLRKFYYDPSKYKTYLQQLGIRYPTLKSQ